MISIVIPAHNESSVIARTLSAMTEGAEPREFDIVVVCNGCTDDTANVARRFAPLARVIETEVAGKPHALNLGDQAAIGFPRIYADADVVITPDTIRTLARRLQCGDVLAVAPPRTSIFPAALGRFAPVMTYALIFLPRRRELAALESMPYPLQAAPAFANSRRLPRTTVMSGFNSRTKSAQRCLQFRLPYFRRAASSS